MSTPTKKTWHSLTTYIAEDIEHVDKDIANVLKESDQRIDNTKKTIGWGWEWYNRDGSPVAVHWDDATEEEVAMLDYAANFSYTWSDARRKLYRAHLLLRAAYEELNKLRMEDEE